MADETRPLDAAHALCGRLLKYYCPDDLAIADKALTQKFNEGCDVGFNQARVASQSIRDAAMAEGWREAQRWLCEIYELDAARKMDRMLREREVSRAKGEVKP